MALHSIIYWVVSGILYWGFASLVQIYMPRDRKRRKRTGALVLFISIACFFIVWMLPSQPPQKPYNWRQHYLGIPLGPGPLGLTAGAPLSALRNARPIGKSDAGHYVFTPAVADPPFTVFEADVGPHSGLCFLTERMESPQDTSAAAAQAQFEAVVDRLNRAYGKPHWQGFDLSDLQASAPQAGGPSEAEKLRDGTAFYDVSWLDDDMSNRPDRLTGVELSTGATKQTQGAPRPTLKLEFDFANSFDCIAELHRMPGDWDGSGVP